MKRKVWNIFPIFALMIAACLILQCAAAQAAVKKPGKAEIKRTVSTAPGKLAVTWKKTPKAAKYQIQAALDKKFSSGKMSKTVSAKKQKCVFTKLQAGENYYVRVRAYRTVSGKKYYGKWSTAKSIKMEKDTEDGGRTGGESGSSDSADARQLSEDDFEISLKGTFYYTGEEIEPAVISLSLVEGEDYKVTYSNNVEVGNATITITGIGEYHGNIVKYFTISKAPQTINATVEDSMMQVGEIQKINVSDTYGEVKYESSPVGIVSVSKDGTITALKAGSASIYLSAGGDDRHKEYNRYLVTKITVTEKEKLNQKINVSFDESQMTVGSTKKISVSGSYGKLEWQFATDGIVSISEDLVITALKAGSTNIYLSAGGDDSHKSVNRHYAGNITVTEPKPVRQHITAELEKPVMYVGETQKINVSDAYGEVTFEAEDEDGSIAISPDGTVTGQKTGWADIYLNASGDETHLPAEKITVGRVIISSKEATAYGFCGGLTGPYKKESYDDARNADGTASLAVRFYCNAVETWIDEHVVFEAQDVTANAYAKMFADMGLSPADPKIVSESWTDKLYSNSRSKPTVRLPFNEDGPVPCKDIAISGKKLTINIDAGTRVVKVLAKKDGEILDYIYLGTTNYKTNSESSVFERDLYKKVRERIEAKLWTDDMSNGDKIGAMAAYINSTTHYPDSPTTNPYENPSYWADWAVDGQILEYWMFQDVTLSEIMALQGGIADCYAAQILNRAAKEDLGLTYLYDGKTVADGEGVWIGLGSQSSNPGNPSHMSLWYKDANGESCSFDASGLDGGYNKGVTCEEHDCRSKIIPLG